jgi:predicted nucleotidyltransferase
MLDESTVTAVQRYLHMLQDNGVEIRFGVIFGSQTTGKADEWSDIDLLVVSPRFDEHYPRQDVDLLWRLAARSDSRIEPIPCGERQWREDDSSAIIEIARGQGERVVPVG